MIVRLNITIMSDNFNVLLLFSRSIWSDMIYPSFTRYVVVLVNIFGSLKNAYNIIIIYIYEMKWDKKLRISKLRIYLSYKLA